MRKYELMLAINPQLEEEELTSLIEKVKKIISKEKGEVTNINKWGKRKLAYEIKDFIEAIYVVMKFNIDELSISEFERVLKLEEKIIRYLLTLQKEEKPVKTKK
ncbi:MAG: 30S ribosomal protein S6 [Candidatus Caldatribacteriota bacterium]|nr:30S ribosomal protein S6 [Candidatus Caldatribacteriota bacterium]